MKRIFAIIFAVALFGTLSHAALSSSATSSSRICHPTDPSELFCDNFRGTTLDLTKWQPNWLGSSNTSITHPVNSSMIDCQDPAQITVSKGSVHLTAVKRPCTDSSGKTYAYASATMTTYHSFTFADGHIEARVYIPGDDELWNWPSFWTDGTGTWPHTGENDIMEVLGAHNACYHYHSDSGAPGSCVTTTKGWHTYAADIRNGVSTYFYDGVQVGQLATVPGASHYIIFNNALANNIGGPIYTPATFKIAYVKVTK